MSWGLFPSDDGVPVPRENRTGPDRAEPDASDRPGTRVADSLAATRVWIRDLVDGSGEVRSVIPAGRLGAEQLSLLRECELAALAGGARVRVLFLDRAVRPPSGARLIREVAAAGADIRFMPVLPFWLTVVDHSAVMTAWNPDDLSRGAIFLHGDAYAGRARQMFDHAWSTARPMTAAFAHPITRSPLERQVLTHLATGVKDEAGARQLGVSPRTYRRHVTRLCERLGASSRFEAGMRAVQFGLIPLADSARPVPTDDL